MQHIELCISDTEGWQMVESAIEALCPSIAYSGIEQYEAYQMQITQKNPLEWRLHQRSTRPSSAEREKG